MGRDPDGKAKMINVDEHGNVKVQLTGSLSQLSKVTSDSASIVAVGTKEHVSFAASGTNLARLVDIGLYVPAVSGATSGTHALYVALGISGGSYDRLWQKSVAYNVSINCNTNSLLANSNTALGAILGGIVFSAGLQLRITYDNQTNAAQEGQRRYRIVKLEGGVPW